jgi:hypothetical protein
MGVVLCSATGLPSPNTAVRPALQPLYTTRSDSAGHGCRLAKGVTLLGGVSRLVGGLAGLVGGVIPLAGALSHLVRKVARLLPGLIGKMGYHPVRCEWLTQLSPDATQWHGLDERVISVVSPLLCEVLLWCRTPTRSLGIVRAWLGVRLFGWSFIRWGWRRVDRTLLWCWINRQRGFLLTHSRYSELQSGMVKHKPALNIKPMNSTDIHSHFLH